MTTATESYQYAPRTEPTLNRVLGCPWRFECPGCASTTVIVRRKIAQSERHYTEYDGKIGVARNQTHIHDFRCKSCGRVFDEPYDSKRGECRPIHDV